LTLKDYHPIPTKKNTVTMDDLERSPSQDHSESEDGQKVSLADDYI
jgi:hypothetical protein